MKIVVIPYAKRVNVGFIMHFELSLSFGLILNEVFQCNMMYYILKCKFDLEWRYICILVLLEKNEC